jgi:hypothetical protein
MVREWSEAKGVLPSILWREGGPPLGERKAGRIRRILGKTSNRVSRFFALEHPVAISDQVAKARKPQPSSAASHQGRAGGRWIASFDFPFGGFRTHRPLLRVYCARTVNAWRKPGLNCGNTGARYWD